MSEAPTQMFIAPDAVQGWAECPAGDCPSLTRPGDTEYIRADIAEAEKAAAVREAVKAERERCARIADGKYFGAVDRANFGPADVYDYRMTAADAYERLATAIRNG